MNSDDYTPYEFDFETEDFRAVADDESARALDDSQSVEGESEAKLSEYYDAESQLQPDPLIAIDSGNKIYPDEMPEVQKELIARMNYEKAAGVALQIDGQIAENGKQAVTNMLKLAQCDTIVAHADNEAKNMLLAMEIGKTTDQKIVGQSLKTVSQQVLNAREYQLIQLEMDKTEVLVESKVQEIRSIQGATQAKALKAFTDSMKSMGVDVSGSLPLSAQ